MLTRYTPDHIAKVAEQVRESGMPDSLNRWLTMSPEELAAADRRAQRTVKQYNDRRIKDPPRRISSKSSGLGMSPFAMKAAGAKLKTEVTTMKAPLPGSKEAQMRALRERNATPLARAPRPKAAPKTTTPPTTTTTPAAAPAPVQQQETTVKTKTAKKAPAKSKAKSKTVARRKVASAAARPAKKQATATKPLNKEPRGMVVTILKLSSRANGVTPAELNNATQWTGAPWKWLFSNPKKTGYADRWGYTFEVVTENGETRYKTTKVEAK